MGHRERRLFAVGKIKNMKGKKILIAVPNLGSVHPLLVMRLLRWATMPVAGVDQVSFFMPTGIIPHDSARNFCVQHFLNTDCTHLFFIDSDVVPPEDALEELIAPDLPVISGLYKAMKQDKDGNLVPKWTVYTYGQDENGDYGLMTAADGRGICQISRAGAGCLIIRRDVLEAIGAPWFRFQYDEKGNMHIGEDIAFCANVERVGFSVYAHFDVRCKHLKEIFI